MRRDPASTSCPVPSGVRARGSGRPTGEEASRDVRRAGRARPAVAAVAGAGISCVPRVDRRRVARLSDEDDHVVHLAPLTGNDVEARHVARPVRPGDDEAAVVVPPLAPARRVRRELEPDVGACQAAGHGRQRLARRPRVSLGRTRRRPAADHRDLRLAQGWVPEVAAVAAVGMPGRHEPRTDRRRDRRSVAPRLAVGPGGRTAPARLPCGSSRIARREPA